MQLIDTMYTRPLSDWEVLDLEARAWDIVAALGQPLTARTGLGVEYKLRWSEMDVLARTNREQDAKAAFYSIRRQIESHPVFRDAAEREFRREYRRNVDAGDTRDEAAFFARHPQ